MENIMENATDMGPFLAILGQVIGWTFFIIVLGMFKKFISQGLSWAIGEFLFANSQDEKLQNRICKWFGNGDEIIKFLKEMEKKQSKKIT